MSEKLIISALKCNNPPDLKNLLEQILNNPDLDVLIDCSFEASPFWAKTDYSKQDPKPEHIKKAYWEEVDRLKDTIAQSDNNFNILVGSFDLQHIHSNRTDQGRQRQLPTEYGSGSLDSSPDQIRCWPTRFLFHTVQELAPWLENNFNNTLFSPIMESGVVEKLFVSHMHFPKTHRCALFEILMEKDVVSKGSVRFCNNMTAWRHLLNICDKNPESIEFINNVIQYAPDIFSPYKYSPGSPKDRTTPIDPHYAKGLFDISPESHSDLNFITQKSCQPLLWGKPFCMMGSSQQNTILKKLGFEVFDEIFDLSHETDFLKVVPSATNTSIKDDEFNFLKDHYQKLLKNLWDVDDSKQSILDMKDKFRDKVDHNLNRYMEILFDDDMLPEYQEIRDSFLVVGTRNMARKNTYLQRYIPVDKRKDIK